MHPDEPDIEAPEEAVRDKTEAIPPAAAEHAAEAEEAGGSVDDERPVPRD